MINTLLLEKVQYSPCKDDKVNRNLTTAQDPVIMMPTLIPSKITPHTLLEWEPIKEISYLPLPKINQAQVFTMSTKVLQDLSFPLKEENKTGTETTSQDPAPTMALTML